MNYFFHTLPLLLLGLLGISYLYSVLLRVVRHICTKFGWNWSRHSRVMNYFFTPPLFLLGLLGISYLYSVLLWVVRHICTKFGWNWSRHFRVLNYFCLSSLLTPRGAAVSYPILFFSGFYIISARSLVEIVPGILEFWITFICNPFQPPLLGVLEVSYSHSVLSGLLCVQICVKLLEVFQS